ncbi:helix-turn-helix domain-containing protein [Flavobacterium sp.]|uniref:helix-turn-helix domain-containing protein n=1 Tax=Flavobacterium sp. TaxID=239 RepID=UPI00248896AA|nr:helix-turn-helix domain-containing protein [Flavobacterium sp.]MDI1315936.1 helix-turn-helix domain-containing protein [Flavobacterium sp.]
MKLVLEEHNPITYVSTIKGPSRANIRKWIGFYKEYGEIGLLPSKNQSYSVDFKISVIRFIELKKTSLREASIKFNIPDSAIIIKWQRDFANFGVNGLNSQPRGRPKSMSNFKRSKRTSDKPLSREEELLLENERLRCELDLLKKLQALIQAEKTKKRKP